MSSSRLDIQDSLLTQTSLTMGGGSVNNSLIQGVFKGDPVNPSEFSSVRKATVDNSSVLYGSGVLDKAHVLNGVTIGAVGKSFDWLCSL